MELCGVYLNRGRYILTVVFVPIAILLMKTENLLLALRQDEKVAHYTQIYI
jgi:hypothetical protein